jgi:hypothetical protein
MALVVFVGPQASGKSTIARALGDELRRQGERVALVELDQIAAMALPTLPSWSTAARIFAMVVGEWARADLTCVIAEGMASQEEVSILLGHTPANVAMVVVAMTTQFEVAVTRAQQDATRGASRDPGWLADRYREWEAEMPRIEADVLLDAGALPTDEGVQQLRAAVSSARSVTTDD